MGGDEAKKADVCETVCDRWSAHPSKREAEDPSHNVFVFSEVTAVCSSCLWNVSVGRKEEKVAYVLESSEEETKQNVCRSKNSHTFMYIASTCDSG